MQRNVHVSQETSVRLTLTRRSSIDVRFFGIHKTKDSDSANRVLAGLLFKDVGNEVTCVIGDGAQTLSSGGRDSSRNRLVDWMLARSYFFPKRYLMGSQRKRFGSGEFETGVCPQTFSRRARDFRVCASCPLSKRSDQRWYCYRAIQQWRLSNRPSPYPR